MLRDTWLKDPDVRCLEFYSQKGSCPLHQVCLNQVCCWVLIVVWGRNSSVGLFPVALIGVGNDRWHEQVFQACTAAMVSRGCLFTKAIVADPIRHEAISPLRVRWHDFLFRNTSRPSSPRLTTSLLGRTSVLIRSRSGPLYRIRLNEYTRLDKTATPRVSFTTYQAFRAFIALSLRGTDALAPPSLSQLNGRVFRFAIPFRRKYFTVIHIVPSMPSGSGLPS